MGRHPMAAGAARSLAVALALAGACTGGATREPAAVPAAPPAAAAPDRPCVLPRGAGGGAASWEDEAGRAEVVAAGSPCARRFTLRTTAALRDGEPDNPRVVLERPGQPALRTGSDLFDALYALALAEVREASVASIRDDAFGGGQPLPCPPGGCFETGRLWTYVWTRDTAYAVDLALAAIDPLRARNSLELKLSERRGGGDVQVVQDTGSGGSYPISTDRVAWAYGAARLLHHLDGAERDAFSARALEALGNTIEHDRVVVFDEREGLYRGETSFLDWREQTYPPGTAADTVPVGSSRALSTNAAHLRAIELAAELAAERGDRERADRWSGWARALRAAIAERFALPGTPLLASYRLSVADPAPVRRFDLFGLALAVDAGIVTGDRAAALVRAYPWLMAGPPVVWPQDAEQPIYHNRAVWPFVTAYWLRAAHAVGDGAIVTRGVMSLVRGAALNLSNMENFEAVTGKPEVDDGPRSGPVVNSQRQLWSVAGYLSMVHDVLFGIGTTADGLVFRPLVPLELRRRLFGGADTLVLDGLSYRGARLAVVLELPPAGRATSGAYRVGRVRVNGRPAPRGRVARSALDERNLIEIELIEPEEGPAAEPPPVLARVSGPEELFSPPAPLVRSVVAARGRLRVRFELPAAVDPAAVGLRVYRDGALIADDVPGSARAFTDPERAAGAAGACYTVEAFYRSSGNTSHRAAPRCWTGRGGRLISRVRPGRDGGFAIGRASGRLWLRLDYRNPGPINTGVTCAVRRMDVIDDGSGEVLASEYVPLPHTGTDGRRARSAWVPVEVKGGPHRLRVRLAVDERAVNMSAFRHFERYTGGAGGASGPRNDAELIALEVYRLAAGPRP
ncbi:MAG TPA: hypothetical protein VKZ63_14485 [Kofleriaceae bacterium]|nr:hypothetical protein [Kofleriaceae bacterium]